MAGVMQLYYLNRLITEEQCRRLEDTGAAHVARGASGGTIDDDLAGFRNHDPANAWMLMLPGPGNCWIETVEGNCPHCGCQARLHQKKPRGGPPLTLANYDYGTLCPCGCRVDIPHGSVEAVLGLQ